MLILNIGGLTDESCCNKKSRCFRIYFEKNIRNKKRKKLRSIKIYTKLRQVQIILCICCNLCSKTGPDFINQNPLIEGVLPSILQLSRAKRSIIPISSFLILPVLNATRSSCSTISFFSRTEKVLYPSSPFGCLTLIRSLFDINVSFNQYVTLPPNIVIC